jgi:cell division protein FtsB
MSSDTPPQKKTSQAQKPVQPKRPPTPTRGRYNGLTGIQIMFAAIIAIGLILAINFSARITSSRPLNEFYQSVENEISILRQEQATLIAEKNYAESPAFVQQWARADGKMIRPGEVLVIPLSAGLPSTPTPIPPIFNDVQTSPEGPENWQLWWSLMFDSPPPDLGG